MSFLPKTICFGKIPKKILPLTFQVNIKICFRNFTQIISFCIKKPIRQQSHIRFVPNNMPETQNSNPSELGLEHQPPAPHPTESPDNRKVVPVEEGRQGLKSKQRKNIRLTDIRATEMPDSKGEFDKDNNPLGRVRYEVRIDAPGKGKVYRRTVKFIVPRVDQKNFLDARKKETINFHSQDIVDQYRRYKNEHRGRLVPWNKDRWLTEKEFEEGLEESGYDIGMNRWQSTQADSVEQVIARMLKQNNFDLLPSGISLDKPLLDKKRQLRFYIDGREFNAPLAEVETRVKTVFGLLQASQEQNLNLYENLIRFRQMDFNKILRLPDGNEKKLALQVLGVFAGIPIKVLQKAKQLVNNGEAEDLFEEYERVKIKERQLASTHGRRPRARRFLSQKEQNIIDVFETLGLKLRGKDGFSFATAGVNQAFLKRLRREPWEHLEEKTQSLLDEARESVKTLNLKKLGFKGLQKELESANLSQQEQNVMYIAAILETGHSARYILDDFCKKDLLEHFPVLEVNRTAARIALDLYKTTVEKKSLPEFQDKPIFEANASQAFKDPNDKRPQSLGFVARKQVQVLTGRQFVEVSIARPAVKAGQNADRDRVFRLPKDSSVVGSLGAAKTLQNQVADIFWRRAREEGQRFSFVPHIELLKGKAKQNPKFRLTLGTSSGEVDYKTFYESLSFENKVKVEVLKATYLDNKKNRGEWSKDTKEWQKQAVYMFQNILSHSGLPSLTEQLIVSELKKHGGKPRGTVAILDKVGKVIKTGVEKTAKKVSPDEPIIPTGIISAKDVGLILEEKAKLTRKAPKAKVVKAKPDIPAKKRVKKK